MFKVGGLIFPECDSAQISAPGLLRCERFRGPCQWGAAGKARGGTPGSQPGSERDTFSFRVCILVRVTTIKPQKKISVDVPMDMEKE